MRHHPEPYDNVMAGQSPAERQQIEATLAGLRFVRNRISGEAGLARFIRAAAPGKDPDNGRVTGWTWKPVPPPALASLPRRAQAWERTRYQAYHAQLARHTLGEVDAHEQETSTSWLGAERKQGRLPRESRQRSRSSPRRTRAAISSAGRLVENALARSSARGATYTTAPRGGRA